MKRTLIYNIDEKNKELTIEKYLRKEGYSKQNITELKKMPQSILINGEWEHVSYKLKADDILTVQINETEISQNIPPVNLPLDIIYEDEDILVVNKPANMPIHPSLNNYENTLGNAVMFYYLNQGQPFVFRCVNRLDKDTSGLTIIAKNMLSAGILFKDMRERKIRREYYAVVSGSDIKEKGRIEYNIARKDGSTIERVIDPSGQKAVTLYEVIEKWDNYALVRCILLTGRTHQIRVHMKAIGHPLAGDFLYNPEDKSIDRQALHAGIIAFTHPISKKDLRFFVPIPEDMKSLCR